LKAFAIDFSYQPNAMLIATAVPAGSPVEVAATVNVSFPPPEPTVSEMFVPATNLPFKKPGVVSVAEIETCSSVSVGTTRT